MDATIFSQNFIIEFAYFFHTFSKFVLHTIYFSDGPLEQDLELGLATQPG